MRIFTIALIMTLIGSVANAEEIKPDKMKRGLVEKYPNELGAKIFVDPSLPADITNGAYSAKKRDSSGKDGDAYRTIKDALAAMKGGDDIYIREGRYKEGQIRLPLNANGTEKNWSSIQSYPGEWAILDGERKTTAGVVLGHFEPSPHEYWRIERLEVTGGGSSNGKGAGGIRLMTGPVIVRFCYIHDNLATDYKNNPAGLAVYTPRDSIIEFNYFDNNGSDGAKSHNAANFVMFADYKERATFKYGYPGEQGTRRNKIRYNLFSRSVVGIKDKNRQFFTGRNPDTECLVDTYKSYGNDIHHNILIDHEDVALDMGQDFAQIHHNIIASVKGCIAIQEGPFNPLHKVVVYNNTLLNRKGAITWYANPYFSKTDGMTFDPKVVHGYLYNQIYVGGDKGQACSNLSGIVSVAHYLSWIKESCEYDVSKFQIYGDYFYAPKFKEPLMIWKTTYNADSFNKNAPTAQPRMIYQSEEEKENPLFKGTEGANRFIPRGEHKVGKGKTVRDAGIGGDHPYLEGIKLPKYLGAVNPDDSAWVGGVLGLKSVENLKNAPIGNPEWIEK